MNSDDAKKFSTLISSVYAFYRQDVSQFAVGVWWEAMKPFDFVAVNDALNRHCINPDNGQFMPKPADVVRLLQGSSKDSALVAWAKVDRAIRTIGTYESVIFDDALIHAVITDMGGWVSLGNKKEDEWPFVGKEFEQRYRGYSSRNEKPTYAPVMVGMAEAQNTQMGFRSLLPRLVGNHARAQLVYDNGQTKQEEFMRLSDVDLTKQLVSEGLKAELATNRHLSLAEAI